jgi:adenylate cyclase
MSAVAERAGAATDRLTARLSAILEWFVAVGADPADSEDLRLRKGLLLLVSVAVLPVSLVWGTLYMWAGSPIAFAPYVYFVVSVLAILFFVRTHNFALFLLIEQLDILLAPTLSAIPLGGFAASGGVGLWAILAPMSALVFSDVRSGIRWFVAFLVVFFTAGVIGGLVTTETLPPWFNSLMVGLNIAMSSVIVFTLLGYFVRQRQEALAALRVEQEKAEDLLLNVLPSSIAERLKAQPQTIADQVSSATILFADVVDFTPFSQRHPAAEVVGTLDELFSRFDDLAERHGLEKIKTIGDCYMVAAGVPSPRPDHATAIAQMALEMLNAVRADDEVGRLGLELRIGINSGPVIAGVIGRKRFLYDLWGDAVNTASRMESHGTPGDIQITGATYELIKDEFECRRRGMVEVKGKGEMETWYLTGARSNGHRAAQPRLVRSSSSPIS